MRLPSPFAPWQTTQFSAKIFAPRCAEALDFSCPLMTRTWLTTSCTCAAVRMPSRPKAGIWLMRVASSPGWRTPCSSVWWMVAMSPHSQSSSLRFG